MQSDVRDPLARNTQKVYIINVPPERAAAAVQLHRKLHD